MDAERWRQVEQLYYAALKLDPEQWVSFLAQASPGDDQLRRDVESLLAQNDSTTALRGGQLWALANDLLTDLCPSTLSPGQQLGPYRVEAGLGTGGMGEVYRGHDTRLDRTVAIKILRGHGPSDEKRRERFQREARAASALNHPNICAVYDVGECEGRPYLVMEYLSGQTLRQRLRQGLLGLQESLLLAIQIVDALDAAHSRGILHRDIKAANILVTDRHQAKVLDFGIAKIIDEAREGGGEDSSTATLTHLTDPGDMLGTVAYMSPEQARGEKLDARSDLFSFGVLIYEMSTGQLPFKGNTPALVFDAILNREPLPVRKLRSDLPCELEMIIISALEKDRDLRVRTAAELRAALADLIRKAEARSPSPESAGVENGPRARHRRFAESQILVVGYAGAAFPCWHWTLLRGVAPILSSHPVARRITFGKPSARSISEVPRRRNDRWPDFGALEDRQSPGNQGAAKTLPAACSRTTHRKNR